MPRAVEISYPPLDGDYDAGMSEYLVAVGTESNDFTSENVTTQD